MSEQITVNLPYPIEVGIQFAKGEKEVTLEGKVYKLQTPLQLRERATLAALLILHCEYSENYQMASEIRAIAESLN